MKKENLAIRRAAAGMVMAAAMICGLQLSGITALAATGTAAFSANIRSSADPNSTAIGSVEAGTSMELGESKTGTDGNTWYAVTTSSGSTGYIRGDLLNVEGGDAAADTGDAAESTDTAEGDASAESADASSAGVAKAQGDGYAVAMQQTSATITGDCNIRSGAGTSYNKVGNLTSGTSLVVIGQATDDAGQMWYQFYTTGTEQQMTGFVMQDYISLGDVIQTTTTDGGDSSASADGSQPTDYQAVYTADENGTDTWYLYNNVEGTREKIADIDTAIEQAQQAQASAKKSLSTFKTAVIILGIIVALLLVAVTLLILKVKDAMNDGGEVDMLRDRERERRRNRHADDISDLEFDSSTGTSRSERMRQAAYPSGGAGARNAAARGAAAGVRPGTARSAATGRAGAAAPTGRTGAGSRPAAGTRPASRNAAGMDRAAATQTGSRPASRPAGTGADREGAAYRSSAAAAGAGRTAARPGVARSAAAGTAPAGRETTARRSAAPAARGGSYGAQQQSRPVRNTASRPSAAGNSYGYDDEDDLDFDFLDLDDHGKR